MPAVLEKVGVSQAARIAGVSEGAVRLWMKAGRLPYEATAIGSLIALDDLHTLIAQREAAQRDRGRTRPARGTV